MKIVLSLVILGLAFFWPASSDSDGTVIRGKELERFYESMAAIDYTFTVQCCKTGTFYTWEAYKNIGGATITSAKVVSQDHENHKPSGDYCASSYDRPDIVIFIPCFSFLDSFCEEFVNEVDFLWGQDKKFETPYGSLSYDFCCYCPSVLNSCGFLFCQCRGVGGSACNGVPHGCCGEL